MQRLTKALILGICAGIIDVVPMIAQGLNRYANTSAFIQWVVMGIVITHIEIGIKGWMKGLIIAELCAIPIMIIISMEGFSAIIPIILMTAILGSCIGYFGDRYVKK
jgi:threonine/homoserine efflux transporter RhtA